MKVPEFEIEDAEDAYTYYVMILEISEEVFWGCDVAFLESISSNKNAYDEWLNAESEMMRKEASERGRK